MPRKTNGKDPKTPGEGNGTPARADAPEGKPDPSRQEVLNELRGLLVRAHDGDRKALPRLREILDAAPSLARRFVDPAEIAEKAMVKRYAGGGEDLVAEEALPRVLEEMRREFAGESPTPIERLLAERVVATWLQLQYFEAVYAQNLKELTMMQGEHYQRRIDRAHRRHLSAVKTLAQARKMGPAVQINIAEKQVNTTG